MKDRKILDYIKNVDYDSLPQSYKDLRQQLTDVGKQYDKLKRDKKKLNDKLQIIYKEQKSVSKQYTKLYNELKFINKSYSPKCYVIEQKKINISYLYLKIDHTKTTTIFLGNKDEVINILLQPHIKNLNNKNYKFKINDFLTPIISQLISYDDPNWLSNNKLNLKIILSSLNDDSNLSFFERIKKFT